MAETPRSQIADKGWTAPLLGALRSEDATSLQKIFTSLREYLGTFGDTVSANTPTGSVVMFSGSTAPTGWLVCDGTEILKTNPLYIALFGVIGTTYGETNGSGGAGTTHFRLPNLNGKVPTGYDSSQTEFNALGKTGGAKTHQLVAAEMPSHVHSMTHTHSDATAASAGSHQHTVYGRNSGIPAGNNAYGIGMLSAADLGYNYVTPASGTHTHNVPGTQYSGNTTSAGSGGFHNNLQPYITINYIIKF